MTFRLAFPLAVGKKIKSNSLFSSCILIEGICNILDVQLLSLFVTARLLGILCLQQVESTVSFYWICIFFN